MAEHDTDPPAAAAGAEPPIAPDGRSWHDMGGRDAGPVDRAEHDHALWEKRVDALMVLLTAKGHFTVDGLRRALESLGPAAFETMTYYERWIAAITQNCVETGAVTLDALNARMEAVAARGETYGDAQAPRAGEADGTGEGEGVGGHTGQRGERGTDQGGAS